MKKNPDERTRILLCEHPLTQPSAGFAFWIKALRRDARDTHRLELSGGSLLPQPYRLQRGEKTAYVMGTPIWLNRVDRAAVAEMCVADPFPESRLGDINGTFLLVVINRDAGRITVATDRFCSTPLYCWAGPAECFCSTCYTDIWLWLQQQNRLSLNAYAFYEFIHFQKLFGNKTFDHDTTCLSPASMLSIDCTGNSIALEEKKYWRPSFSKSKDSVKENAAHLAHLLQGSFKKYASDDPRCGLLLSGGLDSRCVLAAAGRPLPCFTVGERKNNEYQVAHLLAQATQSSHYFVRRPDDHYADILESAVRLGAGMNTFDHAHFLSLGQGITPFADVLFHGHGLDYFFQGMYLPTEKCTFAGRPTSILRLREVAKDFAELFCERVKYRLKGIPPLLLVKPNGREGADAFVKQSVNMLHKEASAVCSDEYDVWEYMHLFNLSRHYTRLNLDSMRSFAEERTLAFENDLFDFYTHMPVEQRVGGKVFRQALSRLSPELMRIRNANTNMRPSYGGIRTTAVTYLTLLGKKFFRTALSSSAPLPQDRSWPDRNLLVRQHKRFRSLAGSLAASERLNALGLLDMDYIAARVNEHLGCQGNYGALIATLLTIDQFLRLEPAAMRQQ